MNKEEEARYLRDWGNKCFICGSLTTEKHLVHSIVPLLKHPEHAEPEVIHSYMVCPVCYEAGELI